MTQLSQSGSPVDASDYGEDLVEALGSAVTEHHVDADPDLPTDRFIDREASWLDFNMRVLELAQRDDVPLLERVKFLAIFATGLDEFFMVRVAGLKRRIATGIAVTAPSGLSARDQLELVSTRAHALATHHARAFFDEIKPALAERGIQLLRWEDLDEADHTQLRTFFSESVYPVLTPLAVDPAHPFPYISGLSLNLAVVVRDPRTGEERFARVKVPEILPRFLPLGGGRFVTIEEVIAAHLQVMFHGMEVLESHRFRVTRNQDLEVDEDDVDNLLQALERELLRRRFGPPVRLEVEETTSPRVLDLLIRELGVNETEVYRLPAPLDLAGLWSISELQRPELKYEQFVPATHPRLVNADGDGVRDIFAALRSGDILVHHPYDSFATSVQAFVEQAATDADVLAIKQTLYRTSGDSPIVDALIDAARAGKQVLVLVEIKARFDEEANIRWARKLEQAGCHVVYGLVGLKTHCKLCLVVRREPDGSLRRYAHLGTGNYNPKTARMYEDVGLLTADPAIGGDVADLFNHLSGYTRPDPYKTLLVAPDTVRTGLTAMIRREAGNATAGRPSGITMKVNSLVDEELIDELYAASRAGVSIDLIVRGMCALRPGVPGLSENVRVRSILGRFLEHARIMRFRGGGDDEYWIGSADLMHRNLDRRVETLVRVVDPEGRRILDNVLDRSMSPEIAAWELGPDGTFAATKGVDLQGEFVRSHRAQSHDGPVVS
ncbi:MAG TPA: RNA degradosome polyphosphate kinase [Acidothermaceae bacterium]